MTLSRIVMRLARTPGTEFAGGDDHRGYAPDRPAHRRRASGRGGLFKARENCTVRRFSPDEDPADGRLSKRGSRWFFDYEDEDVADDEPLHRLGEHRFAVGEYVTVTDEDGRPLTYRSWRSSRRAEATRPPSLSWTSFLLDGGRPGWWCERDDGAWAKVGAGPRKLRGLIRPTTTQPPPSRRRACCFNDF